MKHFKRLRFSKQSLLISIGGVLFVLGATFSAWHIMQYWGQQNALPPAISQPATAIKTPTPVPSTISGQPSQIQVPSVNINLGVIPGYYNAKAGVWTSSITDAIYAAVTPAPNNQTGNTFIYGHNRQSVFERLLGAKLGDQAILTTSNGHAFTYKLVNIYDTDPTDLSVFRNDGPPTLTLQTCSGLFYQHRRMFVFSLEKVS